MTTEAPLRSAGSSRRGSAPLIALVLSILVFALLFGLISSQRSAQKMANKQVALSLEQLSLHSLASLFKQELADNFAAFQTSPTWAPCRSSGTLANFLTILRKPDTALGTDPNGATDPVTCPAVNFTLTYTQTEAGGNTVPVSSFITTKFVSAAPLSALKVTFQPAEIIVNARSLIAGPMTTESAGNTTGGSGKRDLANFRSTRALIDVSRVIAAAPGNASCHVCRASPGSVCCDDLISLTYLESGSGRLIDVAFDEISQTLTLTPNPAAPDPIIESVKGLNSTRINYLANSFCIPSIQFGPLAFIVDGASQSGTHYFLSTTGLIYRGDTPVAKDPKLASIGYDEQTGFWFLLLHDGSIMRTTNIEDETSYSIIPGFKIPTARSLAVGEGPPITPPCN